MDYPTEFWQDLWNPEALLIRHGFECVVNCESVLAVGDDDQGEADDIIIRVASGGRDYVYKVSQGRMKLWALGEDLVDLWQIHGNHHWGDQGDIQRLSEALNLGVFIFCDALQNEGKECLHNIGSQREDFPYWIGIWWDEPVHFRLAKLSFGCDDTSTCFWSSSQLPGPLMSHYRICNCLASNAKRCCT